MAKLISVDFTGVESGGGKIRIPEGDYGFEITKVEQKKGKDSGDPYLKFSMKPIKGDPAGLKKGDLSHNCSLTKQSLWNLRNLMEACGKTVPSKAVKIDLDKMVGWQCAGTVIDEEYDNKKHSVITAFFPLEDLPSVSKKSSKKKDEDEEEETEKEEESTEEEEEIFG
jgi:hypothetical protein